MPNKEKYKNNNITFKIRNSKVSILAKIIVNYLEIEISNTIY
jgi:hypothetical protein